MKQTTPQIKRRLEHLRRELRAERISYGELHELQNLAEHIPEGDVELREAAGIPEFPPEVFHHEHAKRELCMLNAGHKAELYGECIPDDDEGDCRGSGWYYRLPDADAVGPFDTAHAADAALKAGK